MVLIAVGAAWIAGLAAVAGFGSPWWMGAAWVAAAAPLVATRRPRLFLACLVAAAIAGWRVSGASDVEAPSWAALAGSEVTLTGTVRSEPDRGRATTGYDIAIERLEAGGEVHRGGKVLVYFEQYADYLPGDRLTIRGDLEEPPVFDGFDFRAYLARQGIAATMFRPRVIAFETGASSLGRWLTDARLRLDRSLQRSLPEPAASLAAGIAFGRDDGLSRDDRLEYNRSGLRHLVAVSGSNVTLVAGLTFLLAVPLIGRRYAWLPAAVTIAVYLAAAGFSPSVLRAGVMAGVFLGGSVVGRPQGGLPALMAAVIAMTTLDPGITFDAGFQLSAAATAGIIMVSPWLTSVLLRSTARGVLAFVPGWACQVAGLTVAASLATAPIMWVTFGEVSLISPLANLLVEPVFPLAFWASIAAALLGLISQEAGSFAGAIAYYPLAYIGWCAGFFASLPFASFAAPKLDAAWALLASAALAVAGLAAYRFRPPPAEDPPRTRLRRFAGARFAAGAAAGICAVAVVPVSLLPDERGELVIWFLDVGQGDAALIQTPHGRQLLIDGGPSGIELARQLGAVMPHWDRSLDAVLVTHPQEDHLAGLVEALRRYTVGTTATTGAENDTAAARHFALEAPTPQPLTAGASFVVDRVRFEVLWPPPGFRGADLNETSLVLRITYGEVTVLLTGDVQGSALRTLTLGGGLGADVLKVPHHGSRTTPPAFIEAVSPAVAIISAGAHNSFGHPHPDVLGALEGTATFRTDQDGRIEVSTNGARITVRTER